MSASPRKPLYAVLMSLVLPGFGQLYNGQVNRAIWLFLVFALLTIPGVVVVALHLPHGLTVPVLALGLLATLGVWLYGMWDAWRGTRQRQDYVPAPWQTSGLYVLVFLLCNVVALPLLIGYVRAHQVEAFRVPSASMEPTIQPHDFIFVDKRYNCPGCKGAVRRGDIAVFTYPNNRTLYYIKRIIGLPGDHIRIQGESVWVNGKPLTVAHRDAPGGTSVIERSGNRQWLVRWSHPEVGVLDLVVPQGRVFFLGDNRSHTVDSRLIGTVSLRDVVGKARQVWFSWGAHGVRWNRLGLVLK